MKEYTEYEFYRDEKGKLLAKPKKPVLSEDEEKQQAVEEYEKNIRNKKVDIRREKLKKIGDKIGSGLKKTGKYLSETELANRAKDDKEKKTGRYAFEEKKDWY